MSLGQGQIQRERADPRPRPCPCDGDLELDRRHQLFEPLQRLGLVKDRRDQLLEFPFWDCHSFNLLRDRSRSPTRFPSDPAKTTRGYAISLRPKLIASKERL